MVLLRPFLGAALLAATLASVFSTQFVVAALIELGVEIDLSMRLKMTLIDLGILQALLPIVASCFAVGFFVAGRGWSKFHGIRSLWYCAAGGSSLVITILLIEFFMQLSPIAGARTPLGLLFQCFAGVAGGFLFSKLSLETERPNA